MKIAFAYDLPFPWHMGGIEKINREESIVLANSNEVHFFTLKWPKMEKDFTDSKVHYHAYFSSSIDTAYRHGRRSIRKALLFSISLFNLFRYRFDVLIIDQFPYVHIPVAWLFCRLTGCKMVMKVAEIWGRDYWERYTNPLTGSVAYAFSRFWVKRADFYIANSMDTKEKLESFTGRYGVTIAFSPILDRPKIEKAIEDSKYNDNPGVIFVGR
ncbi:MAG: glycosyltransferase, partial [Candidatus Micrarchaeaceae archaeon]